MSDEQVSQFMSFTGSADPAQAASYLEMSGGTLDTAVSLYMEHNSGGGGGAGGGGFGGMGGANAGHDMMGGAAGGGAGPPLDVRAPDATRTMRLMDDDAGPHPAYQMMHDMMNEENQQSSAFAASAPVRRNRNVRDVVNAAAAAESKRDDDDEECEYGSDAEGGDDDDDEVEVVGGSAPPAPARLADLFSPPERIMHTAGGFQGARSSAKDSKRWLLVNLQRDSEFSCHALNRDVWRDELCENLVREGFIFWQAMDVSTEGRTYSERYQVLDYPHIAIIDPRTGRLLWRKDGWTQLTPMNAEAFAEVAMDFCSRNSFDRPPTAHRAPSSNGGVAVAAASRPVKRPMHEMSEDQQLQAVLQASLQNGADSQDQEMPDGDDEVEIIDAEDMKPAAAEKSKEEEEPAEAAAAAESTFIKDLLAVEVSDEPAKGARMQLRMPDGKRKVRKFASTDTVRTIYAFLAQSTEGANNDGREFTLMAGFPPIDLVPNMDSSIESCKLSGEAITMRWK